MAKTYKCPACQNEVDRAATTCSNPECRKPLAFCSLCRDVTTYTLVLARTGRLQRDRYTCDRCQQAVVKCLTFAAGAYCNGLARASGRTSAPLCALCIERVGDVGKRAAVLALAGALSRLLSRPDK